MTCLYQIFQDVRLNINLNILYIISNVNLLNTGAILMDEKSLKENKMPEKRFKGDIVTTWFSYDVKRVYAGKRYKTHSTVAKLSYYKDRLGYSRVKFYLENHQRGEHLEVAVPKGFLLWLANGIRKDYKLRNMSCNVEILKKTRTRPIFVNPKYEYLFKLRKWKNGKRPVKKIK